MSRSLIKPKLREIEKKNLNNDKLRKETINENKLKL
jgi:hypothetical protein